MFPDKCCQPGPSNQQGKTSSSQVVATDCWWHWCLGGNSELSTTWPKPMQLESLPFAAPDNELKRGWSNVNSSDGRWYARAPFCWNDSRTAVTVYKAEVSNYTPLILDEVEGIWEEELRLKLSNFASRQNLEQTPPAGSQWYHNWHVPEGRTMGGVGWICLDWSTYRGLVWLVN